MDSYWLHHCHQVAAPRDSRSTSADVDRRRQDHDRAYPLRRCGRRIMRQEEIGGSPVKLIINWDRDETGMIVAELLRLLKETSRDDQR